MIAASLFLAALCVASPDGRNSIEFDAERSTVRVLHNGTVRSDWTGVGLTVDGKRLVSRACSVRKENKAGFAESPVYKKARVDLSANEAFADFGNWGIRLVARDDGVAYRFETALPGRVRIDGETAGLTIPDGATTTYVNFNNYAFDGDRFQCSWESVNETMRADAIATSTNRLVYLPLVFKYTDGSVMSVTESDLHDYPGLDLERGSAADGVRLDGIFAAHPKRIAYGEGWGEEWMYSRTKRLRFRRVLERDDYLCETEGTRTFPWRVFQLAESPAKLLESDIVWALAKPSEGDFSWVKPGKVAWDWWNAFDNQGQKGCNTKTYERFIDFAAKNGVEYVIFDEGWSQRLDIWTYHPDVDVEHLIAFAKERGVGIILWMAWAQIDGEEERVAAHFAKLGAAGFKVDFMDRDDALCVGFVDRFAAACARHRLLLDYHGMYKPTGLQRTYPNVLNFEGVHGLENMKGFKDNCDFMANDLKCLFVRMPAGTDGLYARGDGQLSGRRLRGHEDQSRIHWHALPSDGDDDTLRGSAPDALRQSEQVRGERRMSALHGHDARCLGCDGRPRRGCRDACRPRAPEGRRLACGGHHGCAGADRAREAGLRRGRRIRDGAFPRCAGRRPRPHALLPRDAPRAFRRGAGDRDGTGRRLRAAHQA